MSKLREKKEEIKKEWESCFEMKLEDVFTDSGLNHFWDERTSENEAADMLTAAAISSLIDDVISIAVIRHGKHGKPKDKNKKFSIVVDGKVLDRKFTTPEGAENYREELAKTSKYTMDDIKVVQEV